MKDNLKLDWFSAKENPKKPEYAEKDEHLITYCVLCNIDTINGVLKNCIEFIDFDFEKSCWRTQDGYDVIAWWPIPKVPE